MTAIKVLRFNPRAIGKEVTFAGGPSSFFRTGTIQRVKSGFVAEVMGPAVGAVPITIAPSDLAYGFKEEGDYDWVPEKDKEIVAICHED
jgi:hypothetical protein